MFIFHGLSLTNRRVFEHPRHHHFACFTLHAAIGGAHRKSDGGQSSRECHHRGQDRQTPHDVARAGGMNVDSKSVLFCSVLFHLSIALPTRFFVAPVCSVARAMDKADDIADKITRHGHSYIRPIGRALLLRCSSPVPYVHCPPTTAFLSLSWLSEFRVGGLRAAPPTSGNTHMGQLIILLPVLC